MSTISRKVALITGANSNLGLNIAYRLLETIPENLRLTFVVTSRTLPRVKEVIENIQKYNREKTRRSGVLDFDYVLLDFANMVSVMGAYYDLSKQYSHIDYVFMNASQGVYDGIDWIGATREILPNPRKGVTYPKYKIQRVGVRSKDDMGLVFQGNFFGPFYFLDKIRPLLRDGGRVIWISSVMATPGTLSFNDLELLKSNEPYEGSKRMVELMHLATYQKLYEEDKIISYITHPGIFQSASYTQTLNLIAYWGMMMLFWLARQLGSPWHNINPYTGANAVVKVINYVPDEDNQELMFASASNRSGDEYVLTLDIESTGYSDVLKFYQEKKLEWDEKLKDQIAPTRQIPE